MLLSKQLPRTDRWYSQTHTTLLLTLAIQSLAACGDKQQAPSAVTIPAMTETSAPRHTEAFPPAKELLGANPPPIADYSRTHVYVDLVKQARRFGSTSSPWDEKAMVGDDGWPVGDFGIFLMSDQRGVSGIAGTYTVTFDGQATVAPVASRAQVLHQRYDPSAKRTRLELVLPAEADQLALSFTQTGPGIKNLQVIRPGYDASNPPLFTRAFIDHVQRFGTLRFMDWLRTNNNPVTSWATRTDPQRMRYNSSKGVPWEHIVALANQTGQHVWINIPVAATDDYVRQLAQLLKSTLNANSRIYVEYSNEVWNGQFKQYGSNKALAVEEVKADPDSPLAYDGSQDPNQWAYRRIAKRGKEISDMFRRVFGDSEMMSRIRPVFATQVVNSYASGLGLNFIAAVYGPPARYFYAMAGAPYFNLGKQQREEGLSTDQVLQAMEQSVTDLPRINEFEKNQALASWYGLPWLAYEGGADTFGPGSHDAKMNANLDSRMQDLCRRYLSTWYQSGGQLFMWFNAGAGNWSTQYGAWELTTDLAITDTPKIRCMDQTLAGPTPSFEGRNKAPGSFEAYAFAGNFPPYSEQSKNQVRHLAPGRSIDYLVQAAQAGTYQLLLSTAAASSGNRIDLHVNNQRVANAIELSADGWSKTIDQKPIPIRLHHGFNTLRVTTRSSNGGYDLQRLTLSPQSITAPQTH
ncbi:hypothetical protein [Malikia spinosa]|uniref:CBM6 domain-containing protein n=1 Tax=Malikia spinosa TaxID=86180 RepID=A0A7C9MX10_9BURK|nr:hypothetical protein [Malikia spinosa]MYZ53376.1 hypothetical protein [Malikia spinosa]